MEKDNFLMALSLLVERFTLDMLYVKQVEMI